MASSPTDAAASAAATAAATATGAKASLAGYELSTELLPQMGRAVQAVCVFDDNTIVSGADDGFVTIWRRITGSKEFTSVHVCTESAGAIRAICAIPPVTPALQAATGPEGGFAAGALDGKIRLYRINGLFVKELAAHESGVTSLALGFDDRLISGSWDGSAIVWDMLAGEPDLRLLGHENAVSVLGLENGDVVTGSTGRKNEDGLHTDYKIRIWRDGSILRTCTEHTQAVRDLALLPGLGFVSASNDGSLRVWTASGEPIVQFSNPEDERGEVPFAYRVYTVNHDLMASGHEDKVLRLHSPTAGLLQEIPVPGVPWGLSSFTNGDIVMSCDHAGTSQRGHIYIFTRDPARFADDPLRARFAEDKKPPTKPAGGASGGAGSGGGADGLPFEIKGEYDRRDHIPGSNDGEYGFFLLPTGKIMVCGWNAGTSSWDDIGTYEDDTPGGDGGGGGGGGGGRGGGGEKWDVVRPVTVDIETGGTKRLMLRFNFDQDPHEVAQTFVQENDIGVGYFEEIRNYILAERRRAGVPDFTGLGSSSSSKAGSSAAPRFRHFPSSDFVDFGAIAWDKVTPVVLAKSEELGASGGAAATLALSPEDQTHFQALVEVLKNEGFYHSSAVSKPQALVVFHKLLRWPTRFSAAALDVARKMVLHHQSANAFFASRIDEVFDSIASKLGETDVPFGVVLISLRFLANLFRIEGTRKAALKHATRLVDLVAPFLSHEKDTVRFVTLVILFNLSRAIVDDGLAAGGAIAKDYEGVATNIVRSLAAVIPKVVDDGAEHRFRALVTFGTLACGGATIKSAVRSAAPADVVARLSMPGVAAEAAEDLLRHLSS